MNFIVSNRIRLSIGIHSSCLKRGSELALNSENVTSLATLFCSLYKRSLCRSYVNPHKHNPYEIWGTIKELYKVFSTWVGKKWRTQNITPTVLANLVETALKCSAKLSLLSNIRPRILALSQKFLIVFN